MITHWIEITDSRRQICHGSRYIPQDSATHYTRWRAGGIELVERYKPLQPAIDWKMAEELKKQDW